MKSVQSERIQTIQQRTFTSLRAKAHNGLVKLISGPVIRFANRRAIRSTLQPGVTIVTVSFNTLGYLQAMVVGIRQHSPVGTAIIVVDNGSSDGSAQWARTQPDVRLVRLPVNVQHGPAMNLGLALCRTEHFVALDVDAFPIDDSWLDRLLAPLDPAGEAANVSGAGYPPTPQPDVQPYVHACCLAMKTAHFVGGRHTFAAGPTWDTGQAISLREWPRVHTIPITSSRGPGILGTVFGEIVYHNFYSARFHTSSSSRIDWVDRGQPEAAWTEAMDLYFPEGLGYP